MKIVALYSIKGGDGKTSSAVNLAFISACNGYRTLIRDLDPQGASSFYFRIKPKVKAAVRI
jgi:chromosome partitioning protein